MRKRNAASQRAAKGGEEQIEGSAKGKEMTEYERRVLEDLSVLKAQMNQLMGIGQPGRLSQLEGRVDAHDRSVQRLKGLAGAFGGLLTVLHAVIAFVGGKH